MYKSYVYLLLGEIYKMPTGTVPLENNQLIPVGENIFLRINLPDAEEVNSHTSDSTSNDELANLDADEVINTPSSSIIAVDYPSNATLIEGVVRKNADWSDKATKLLIQLYAQRKPLVEDRKIKTMKKMWEGIREELQKHNLEYTFVQIESKWKSLERAFKATLDNSKKSGRGRRSCPYER